MTSFLSFALGGQPQANAKLREGFRAVALNQTLLGVTGSGKTFTIANVIAQVNLKTAVGSPGIVILGSKYNNLRIRELSPIK